MTNVSPQPRVKLSKLRDIGWRLWDPIGLLGPESKWDEDQNLHFADEYDNYLISAASQLRRGATLEQVSDYLVQIETQHMCLRQEPATKERADAVVKAIMADPEIWT